MLLLQSGNLCRCTGYRPILDSGRTFCAVSTQERVGGDVSDRARMRRASGQSWGHKSEACKTITTNRKTDKVMRQEEGAHWNAGSS